MRQAGLACDEGAARVDRHHAVVDSHGCLQRPVRLIALALLTRMSIPPKVATAFSTAAATASSRGRRRRAAAPAPGLLDRACRRVDRSEAWDVARRSSPPRSRWPRRGRRAARSQGRSTACTGNEECAVAQRHGIGSGRPAWTMWHDARVGGLAQPLRSLGSWEVGGHGHAGRAHRPQRMGLWVGAALFALLLWLPPPEGFTETAWHAAALAVLMAVWWATEALPSRRPRCCRSRPGRCSGSPTSRRLGTATAARQSS